jgi:hypothetical protein
MPTRLIVVLVARLDACSLINSTHSGRQRSAQARQRVSLGRAAREHDLDLPDAQPMPLPSRLCVVCVTQRLFVAGLGRRVRGLTGRGRRAPRALAGRTRRRSGPCLGGPLLGDSHVPHALHRKPPKRCGGKEEDQRRAAVAHPARE